MMENKEINLLFVGDYRTDGMKELARTMRDNNMLYEFAANLMVPLVPDNAFLIPVPSHNGKPGVASKLVASLSKFTGAPAADLLTCSPHPSAYELKNKGLVIQEQDMKFRLLDAVPQGYIPVIVDNVTASGNTALAAMKAAGADTILVFADDAQAIGRRAELDAARERVMQRRDRLSETSLYTWPHNKDKAFVRARIDGNHQISMPISRRMALLGYILKDSRFEHILDTVIAEHYYAEELKKPIDRSYSLSPRR